MRIVGLLIALAGCFPAEDGGQSGTEFPVMCVETGREPVPFDGTPEGIGFSPRDAAEALGGARGGEATDAEGAPLGPADLLLELTSAEKIAYGWLEIGEGGPLGPAPADAIPEGESCASRLVLLGTAQVSVSDLLDETFPLALVTASASEAAGGGAIPLAEVRGTARPSWDPGEWDANDLVLDLALSGDDGSGSVLFSASREPQPDTGGTVGVSGTTESVAGLSSLRGAP